MILDTPRLTLRPWTEGDAADMHAVFSDPEAMAFWNAPPTESVDEMREIIARSRAAPLELHRAWAAVLTETGKAIGFVNYHHRDVRNGRLEIGYILARPFWRQGLATEAVSALIDHCFEALDTHRIEATIDPENVASRRFVEHLGFRLESGPMRGRVRVSPDRFADALMYGLLAEDWRGRAG